MKKISKRLVSLFLSILMVVTMIPTFAITASAATEYRQGTSLSNLTFTKQAANGTVETDVANSNNNVSKLKGTYYDSILYTQKFTGSDYHDITTDKKTGSIYFSKNTVFLDDGSTPMMMPIMMREPGSFTWAGSNTWCFTSLYPCQAQGNTADSAEFSLKDKWRGGNGVGNLDWYYALTYADGSKKMVGHNSSTTSDGENVGNKGAFSDSKVPYYANSLIINRPTNYGNYKVYSNIYWYLNARSNSNKKTASITTNDSKIYVVNYAPMANILASVETEYNNYKISGDYYTKASMDAYENAVKAIANFKLSDYDFSNDTENTVKNCGNKIAELVNTYNNTAKPVKHTHTYPSDWTTVEGNCVTKTILVKECTDCPLPDKAAQTQELSVVSDKHSVAYDSEVVLPATCTTNGKTKYTCQNGCGYNFTVEDISALEHNYTSFAKDWDAFVNDTTAYTHTKTCPNTNCPTPSVTENCSFGEWAVSQDETTETRECSVCGGVQTREHQVDKVTVNFKLPDGTIVLSETVDPNTEVTAPSLDDYAYNDAQGHHKYHWENATYTVAANMNVEAIADEVEEHTTSTRNINFSNVDEATLLATSCKTSLTYGYDVETYCTACEEVLGTDHETVDPLNHTSNNTCVLNANNTNQHITKCSVCEAVLTSEEHTYSEVTTNATCQAQGYTTYTCTKCNYSYKDNYTQFADHTYGDYVSNEDGSHYRQCSVCTNKVTELCDLTSTTVPATCTENAFKSDKCAKCDYEQNNIALYSDDGVEMNLFSSERYEYISGSATYTHWNNVVNGLGSYKYVFIRGKHAKTGTDRVTINIPLEVEKVEFKVTCHTHNNNGSWIDVNDDNGSVFKFNKEEKTDSEQVKTLTAYDTNTIWFQFDLKNEMDYLVIDSFKIWPKQYKALGHSFTNYVSNGNATCTSNGTETAKCDRCDATDTKEEANSMLEHSFTNFVSNDNATCTENCTETAKCDSCDATKTQEIPNSALGHTYETEVASTTANCVEVGTVTYQCVRCTDTKTEYGVVDPTNHKTPVTDNAVESTCSATGLTEGSHCEACGETIVAQLPTEMKEHEYGAWTPNEDGTTHSRVCANCPSTETEDCTEEDYKCPTCGRVYIDTTAYGNAVTESNTIIADVATYSAESFAKYMELVDAAKATEKNTQKAYDDAAAAILSAKDVLRKATITIKLQKQSYEGNVTTETLTRNYGEKVELQSGFDNVAKWTITTVDEDGKQADTMLERATSTIELLAAKTCTVTVYEAEDARESEKEYTTVKLYGKNGVLVGIKYFEKGTKLTLDDAPEVAFYTFTGWTLEAKDGDVLSYYAHYEFTADEEKDRCNVHYNGTVRSYGYDQYVYLGKSALDKTLALSTTENGYGLLTYIDGDCFYAPHAKDIYVIEVGSKVNSIAVTGSYALKAIEPSAKGAVFNCKFYALDMSKVQEFGIVVINPSTGAEKIVKADSASENNEYSVRVNLPSTTSLTSLQAKAYVVIDGVTLYSDVVTQTL